MVGIDGAKKSCERRHGREVVWWYHASVGMRAWKFAELRLSRENQPMRNHQRCPDSEDAAARNCTRRAAKIMHLLTQRWYLPLKILCSHQKIVSRFICCINFFSNFFINQTKNFKVFLNSFFLFFFVYWIKNWYKKGLFLKVDDGKPIAKLIEKKLSHGSVNTKVLIMTKRFKCRSANTVIK